MEPSPTRLDQVVLTDRRRVDAVALEAGRDTETPGVRQDLAVDLVATMRAHLAVLDDVLAEVGVERGESERRVREALARYESGFDPEDLRALTARWAEDAVAVDEVIDHLHETSGERTVARLGLAFSDRLESRGYRRARASADHLR